MAEVDQEKWGAEHASTQRVRQADALLVQLYQDAVDPHGQIPAVRGLKVIFFVSLLSVVMFVVTVFYNYNLFVMLHEDVLTKNGNLLSAIQRRSSLFPNLVKLTLSHAALEEVIYAHAADMRADSIKKSNGAEAAVDGIKSKAAKSDTLPGASPDISRALEALAGDHAVDSSIGRLLGVVEQYPTVRSSETYKEMMSSLVDMENIILNDRLKYNEAVREYNTAINKFPWYLLAQYMNFDRAKYFDGQGVTAPVISPSLYEQLVPMSSKIGEHK
ncbi:MAG: LemA family protein [Alphaproteobacteria bacterium]|nr:LemA family protein [Alphaproteobacteria bacterium]